MFKLFRNLKPYTVAAVLVIVLVAAQAVSELYLPTLMSDIVDTGIMRGGACRRHRLTAGGTPGYLQTPANRRRHS